MKEIIKVENLTKVYSAFKGAKEHKALDGISFDIKKRINVRISETLKKISNTRQQQMKE